MTLEIVGSSDTIEPKSFRRSRKIFKSMSSKKKLLALEKCVEADEWLERVKWLKFNEYHKLLHKVIYVTNYFTNPELITDNYAYIKLLSPFLCRMYNADFRKYTQNQIRTSQLLLENPVFVMEYFKNVFSTVNAFKTDDVICILSVLLTNYS